MSATVRKRSLEERLEARRVLLGLVQSRPEPTFIELAGLSGYDFIMLDCEHGMLSEEACLQLMPVFAAADVLAIVRLRGHDPQTIGRLMDVGADGLMVPNVCTVEQAQKLACAMWYPPRGTRGLAPSLHRAARYGIETPSHLKAPRSGVSLFVILESAQAAQNAREILAVPDVDGAILGQSDLAADLGFPGDLSSAAFAEATAAIEAAAAAQGKLLGTLPHPGQPVPALVARGHRMLILGSDISLMRGAMKAQAQQTLGALT